MFDAYTAAASGYKAVAVLGVGNADERLAKTLIPQLGSNKIILAFDGDKPGREATARLQAVLPNRTIDLRIPDGKDLNSLLSV